MTPADYIDRHPTELLRLLGQLVGISTVNPPGNNYGLITRRLQSEMEAVGLSTRRYQVSSRSLKKRLPEELRAFPRFNLLGRQRSPGAKKTIHFNAHYDVVPVSGQWRHGSPFSGVVDQGWIYGRGSADMKGAIASLLVALRSLRATGTLATMNIEVSFTADEETDSSLGTGWIVQHAPVKPDYAVVMEGGEGHAISCGHNGTVWLEVTVHGHAAHGSTPEAGINALEKMSALVRALDDYKHRLVRRTWRTPENKKMHPTINVGGVFDCGEGAKINTVPALARFTIDRRVLAIEDHATAGRELCSFLAAAARRIPNCRISVRRISENFSCFTPPTHPIFAAMADCVRRVRGEKTAFSVTTGFNDMLYFARNLGIPTLGYGPGGERCHGVDERARVKELLASAKIYAGLLTTFSG